MLDLHRCIQETKKHMATWLSYPYKQRRCHKKPYTGHNLKFFCFFPARQLNYSCPLKAEGMHPDV